jgi:hypothetical protein
MKYCALSAVLFLASSALAQQYSSASLVPILEALYRAKVPGSIEISEDCAGGHLPTLPLFSPRVTTNAPPLQALQEIAAGDPAVHVTQDPYGAIRMVAGNVPTDLLNVRIRHIDFDTPGWIHQYSYYPRSAAWYVIMAAPEVTEFMKTHDLHLPKVIGLTGGAGHSPEGLPHLSGTMDNVTVAEALDRVLQTFPGIWVYWDCPVSEDDVRATAPPRHSATVATVSAKESFSQLTIIPGAPPFPTVSSAPILPPLLFDPLLPPSPQHTVIIQFFYLQKVGEKFVALPR